MTDGATVALIGGGFTVLVSLVAGALSRSAALKQADLTTRATFAQMITTERRENATDAKSLRDELRAEMTRLETKHDREMAEAAVEREALANQLAAVQGDARRMRTDYEQQIVSKDAEITALRRRIIELETEVGQLKAKASGAARGGEGDGDGKV